MTSVVPSQTPPQAAPGAPTEEEFLAAAHRFLEEIGTDCSGLAPDANLFETGVLDSLATLAYLDFLEQQLGHEIDVATLDIAEISTLLGSYAFVLAGRS